MAEHLLGILPLGTVEAGGGGASVTANLMRAYRARGYRAWLAVGHKSSRDPAVVIIPDDDRAIRRWKREASRFIPSTLSTLTRYDNVVKRAATLRLGRRRTPRCFG